MSANRTCYSGCEILLGTSTTASAAEQAYLAWIKRFILFRDKWYPLKYHNDSWEWSWEYVFFAKQRAVDPCFGKECFHHRCDPDSRKRYKTVEIIVEEVDYNPTADQSSFNRVRGLGDRMGTKVDIDELELRDRVKRANGIWRFRQKLWELIYAQIVFLGLEDRIRGDVTKSI